jgi:ParB-like chromosome segregation protein Spo0J
MELVSARHIKRMPGLHSGAVREEVVKVKEFVKRRGYCNPVVLSDSDGSMTLLSGSATFEACLEEKGSHIPAVIVQTTGEADDLMFALQSAELNETLSAIAAATAIVRLIDIHNVPRKHIVETLGKSPAWLNRMESLCRSLNIEVQRLVADGQLSPRSAQEIARLPKESQVAFSISVSDNYINKDNIAYLVNRYLNEDTGYDERTRIINSPKLVLPNEAKHHGKLGRDNSVSARLSRAISRCLDSNTYLTNALNNIDISETAVRMTDINALIDSLIALHTKLRISFPPGGNKGGDKFDRL